MKAVTHCRTLKSCLPPSGAGLVVAGGASRARNLSSRVATLGAITNPLKFFALALLLVEALIGGLSLSSSSQLLILSVLTTGMFSLVVIAVVWLVARHPGALLAQKASDLSTVVTNYERVVRDLRAFRAMRQLIGTVSARDIDELPSSKDPVPIVTAPPPKGPR